MSRVDHHLQSSVMGRLGSFWSRVVTDRTKSQVRAIATLAAGAPALRRLDLPIQKLMNTGVSRVENVWVPYVDGDYVVVGPDMARLWRSELQLQDGQNIQIIRLDLSSDTARSQVLVGANGRPLGENLGHLLTAVPSNEASMTDTRYVVPIPAGLCPIVICAKQTDRVLVSGIDFETGDGFIVLRESPSDVLSAGGFMVLLGNIALRQPYDFLTQVNGRSYGSKFITSYYRGSASRTAFERAAAQACGLLVLEQDDTVVQAVDIPGGIVRYVFLNAGVIDVPYPHRRLTAGEDYQRGFVVSNGFSIFGAGGVGWLRQAAGDQHLSMDGVLPVPGLYLPPQSVTVYYTETGAGGKPHARTHLVGSDAALSAYWLFQRGHERLTNLYLADEIGLSTTQRRVTFDMHALIEAFYGNRLLVVKVNFAGADPSYLYRLREFVHREKPLNSLVLVAETPSGLPAVGSFEPSGEIDGLLPYADPVDLIPSGAVSYGNRLFAYLDAILVYQADE